ncbi:MAG: hypothetical protein KGJ88_11765 [Verrucomicrobiota bacterium]|nr:hypothetical protein [Verrucomicrobiota bacterium]
MSAVQYNPPRILTHWRRFSNGLWRVPEGDIAAAYCADTFPKIKVFTHEGRLFTNCGCNYSNWFEAEVNCHPLIAPGEYRGAENVPYSYEGREAAYRGEVFKLGAKVLFVASDPTLTEWRRLIRVLYADGGYFVGHSTYAEFLADRFKLTSGNGVTTREMELAECAARRMPQTQEEMRRLLGGESSMTEERYQMRFAL